MYQVRIHRFLEKTKKKKNTIDKKAEADSVPVTIEQEKLADEQEKLTKEQERLRKKVNKLIKRQKMQQVRGIVKEQEDLKPWGQEAHVKVCDVYRFK